MTTSSSNPQNGMAIASMAVNRRQAAIAERKREAAEAMREIEDKVLARRMKTAKLRALRIANEVTENEDTSESPDQSKKKSKTKK